MIDRRQVIAVAAAAAAAGPALGADARRSGGAFPRGFLWGASTAGHQIEGNNVASDMWFVENRKPTFYPEPSGDACNSFELWPADLDLVKQLGLNAYRFSLEWSRIEPEPGQFSNAMLDHYKAVIEGCRARGITPFVTFNHYSAPLWFAVQGGWTNPQSPGLFARYCERAARHLAGGIGYAATLNEPNISGLVQDLIPEAFVKVIRGVYQSAGAATGSAKFTLSQVILPEDAETVSRNLIAAHHAGRTAIKAVRPELPVGVCLAMQDDEAAGPDSLRDRKREQYYGAWLDAVKGDDFLGVQNYLRWLWGPEGKVPDPPGGRRNADGAQVYPASLANTVRYAHGRTGLPILVTEHGVNTADDTVRAWLIPAALHDLKAVMDEGAPVKGYLHWSLLDNFEWAIGYRARYGLVAVDRTTFRRTVKPSARVYGAIARRNAV
jgi:beta-glucosidase